jgi:fumarate reductase subunit C
LGTLRDSVRTQRNKYAQKLEVWTKSKDEYNQYLEREGLFVPFPTFSPTPRLLEKGEALRKRMDEAWEQVRQAQRDLL